MARNEAREFRRIYTGRTREEVRAQYEADAARLDGYRSFSPTVQRPYPFWPLILACIFSIPLLGAPLVLFVIVYRNRPWKGEAHFYRR